MVHTEDFYPARRVSDGHRLIARQVDTSFTWGTACRKHVEGEPQIRPLEAQLVKTKTCLFSYGYVMASLGWLTKAVDTTSCVNFQCSSVTWIGCLTAVDGMWTRKVSRPSQPRHRGIMAVLLVDLTAVTCIAFVLAKVPSGVMRNAGGGMAGVVPAPAWGRRVSPQDQEGGSRWTGACCSCVAVYRALVQSVPALSEGGISGLFVRAGAAVCLLSIWSRNTCGGLFVSGRREKRTNQPVLDDGAQKRCVEKGVFTPLGPFSSVNVLSKFSALIGYWFFNPTFVRFRSGRRGVRVAVSGRER